MSSQSPEDLFWISQEWGLEAPLMWPGMLSRQAARLAHTPPGSVVNTNYPAVSKHALGFTAGGFNDEGWESSQFSLALLANFGASLHNAVSKEQDSGRTEHIRLKIEHRHSAAHL